MNKLIMLTLVSILFSFSARAQEIKAYKTFGGVRFERDTTELSMNQVMSILKDNSDAYEEIKKAKRFSGAAAITGFSGAIMLALPLGTAIAGGEPEWALAAVGAALIITSIPLNRAFQKHTSNALEIFNNKTSRIKPEFLWMGSRAKLVIRF